MSITDPITEQEAAEYLRKKKNAPTPLKSRQIAALWNDEAKTRAFFSARVAKADILQGIRDRVQQVVEGKGGTGDARHWIREFLKSNGDSALVELGFLPESEARESESMAELGSVRRLNLIIEQNVRQAHAVGEFAEMQENKDMFPYVEYKTAEDANVRNSHRILEGKIFRVDDPILARITPPQDFNCRCYLRQLDEDEAAGRKIESSLPSGWKPPKSGYSFDVTKGLGQALPEKEQWGKDIKDSYGKEIKEDAGEYGASDDYARTINTMLLPDSLDHSIQMTSLNKLKSFEEYDAAKNHGDNAAALKIVDRVLKKDKLKELENLLDKGRETIFVPIINSEMNKRLNVLPNAYAQRLAETFNGNVLEDIVKIKGTKNTGATQSERLLKSIGFDGNITSTSAQYVIVDDNYTSGKTIMAFMEHIKKEGGDVKAVTTLAASRYGAGIKISELDLDKLRSAVKVTDKEIENVIGHKISQFTKAELNAVLSTVRTGGFAGLKRLYSKKNG